MKSNVDPGQAAFLSVYQMAIVSGVSQYAIRKGIKDGAVPHIRSGRCILIAKDAFLNRLNEMAERGETL